MFGNLLSKQIRRGNYVRNFRTIGFVNTTQLRNLSIRQFATDSAEVSTQPKFDKTSRSNKWRALISGAVLGGAYFGYKYLIDRDDEICRYVTVDEGIDQFPTKLGPPAFCLDTTYSLLGYGVRCVTVATFKVYGLGIYIARRDQHLIPDILNSSFLKQTFIDTDPSKSHQENLKIALDDPEKSSILIGSLLDAGVRMATKLTPIKSTNLTFVREGVVKTVKNHPHADANKDLVDKGVDELRQSFSKKGAFPKNDDLIIELKADGQLDFYYYNRKKEQCEKIAHVSEPIIGKFLFSQYMSGPNPLSQETKDMCVRNISSMV